jgi:hypothetical protein
MQCYPVKQDTLFNWFRNEINRAGIQRSNLGSYIIIARQEDDWNIAQGTELFEPGNHFKTIHPRHFNIKQDHVKGLPYANLKRLGAGLGEGDAVMITQEKLDITEIGKVVINNQYVLHIDKILLHGITKIKRSFPRLPEQIELTDKPLHPTGAASV